ncbi:hypothetical protein LTR85_004432 [Meristemomyces frigidus]|nr:hypothetical protein LTR85_004432 [Meristemomyces frigidus]
MPMSYDERKANGKGFWCPVPGCQHWQDRTSKILIHLETGMDHPPGYHCIDQQYESSGLDSGTPHLSTSAYGPGVEHGSAGPNSGTTQPSASAYGPRAEHGVAGLKSGAPHLSAPTYGPTGQEHNPVFGTEGLEGIDWNEVERSDPFGMFQPLGISNARYESGCACGKAGGVHSDDCPSLFISD